MHQRREHEDDARVAQRARHHLDRSVDRDAERLEHVGAAALRGERAVAVLRDAHSRAGATSSAAAVEMLKVLIVAAAGAAGVDEIVAREPRKLDHRVAERADDGGELRRGLAPHAQPDEERRDLRRRRVAPENDVERCRQLTRLGCFARARGV